MTTTAPAVVQAPRKSDLCPYPGCGALDPQPPYRYLRDGVPSVTSVSGMIDLGKSSAFGYAASLIAATVAIHEPERLDGMSTTDCTHEKDGLCAACKFLRQEHAQVWDAKAALGSHVHHLALSWANGEHVDQDEATKPYLDAIEAFYLACKPTWLLTEQSVAHDFGAPDDTEGEPFGRLHQPGPHSYRGKFDGIVNIVCPTCSGPLLGEKRCDWLVDWKTGRFYPAEQTLQVSAYRYAEWITAWDGKVQVVHPDTPTVPTVDHAGVVILSGDGTYRLIELPANEEAFEAFLALRSCMTWHKDVTKWAKELEKEEGETR